jgi:uncharacterized membrane protein YdfJ with MMPL/SSD domain
VSSDTFSDRRYHRIDLAFVALWVILLIVFLVPLVVGNAMPGHGNLRMVVLSSGSVLAGVSAFVRTPAKWWVQGASFVLLVAQFWIPS